MEKFTAHAILAMQTPHQLFSAPANIKAEYIRLAVIWHPDHNHDSLAGYVMAHVNHLYQLAQKAVKDGWWRMEDSLFIETIDGKGRKIDFIAASRFELGEYFIGRESVTYIVNADRYKLVNNYKETVNSFFYKTLDLKERVGGCMPQIVDAFRLNDKRYGLTVQKHRDAILLKDVINYYPKGVPQKHAAWVISRLLMLCVYLWQAGRACNGLTIDTCFISPSLHAVFPLGGWWFAAKDGERIESVPGVIYEILPPEVLRNKCASYKIDLEAVHLIGRQMFKDPSGTTLASYEHVHEALAVWLNSAAVYDPVTEFEQWHTCLARAFGERKFVEMALTNEMVYKK